MRVEKVFDYLPEAPVVFDTLAHEALAERHTRILDHIEARRKQGGRRLERCRALQAGERRDLLYISPEQPVASLGRAEAIDSYRLRGA